MPRSSSCSRKGSLSAAPIVDQPLWYVRSYGFVDERFNEIDLCGACAGDVECQWQVASIGEQHELGAFGGLDLPTSSALFCRGNGAIRHSLLPIDLAQAFEHSHEPSRGALP